ncbi:MAG: two-component regulator propeller domain-containing protein [bacterium]
MRELFLKYKSLFLNLCISIVVSILFTQCDKELSTPPVEKPAHEGNVFITSTPIGFKIYIDGKWRGDYTPDSLFFLNYTTHQIKLRKDLYRDTIINVELSDNQRKNLDINFLSNPNMLGKIEVFSVPENSQIIIDDSVTNLYTPAILQKIIPGKHKVVCKHDGYYPGEKQVIVKSLFMTETTVTLEDTSIWVRYDSLTSAIPTEKLTCVAVDKQNNIWVGTDGKGLIKYDRRTWTEYNMSNSSMPSNYVTAVLCDQQGRLLFTTDYGFVIIDNGNWQWFNTSNSPLPHDFTTSVDVGINGDVLIGTKGGLARYFGTRWVILTRDNSKIPGNWITKVKFDSTNGFWITTVIGKLGRFLCTADGETSWTTYPLLRKNHPSINVLKGAFTAIGDGLVGDKWFGSSYENTTRLASFKSGKWLLNIVIDDNTINQIFVSRDGTKWLGTLKGLVKYKSGTSFITYNYKNSGIKNPFVTGIAQDEQGYLWITTFDGGLVKYKGMTY